MNKLLLLIIKFIWRVYGSTLLNVISGHKCNKVTSVIKISHKCNKVTNVIRFGHKCNKVKSVLNFGHAEQQLSLYLDDVISHGTFYQPFYTFFSAQRCNGGLIRKLCEDARLLDQASNSIT